LTTITLDLRRHCIETASRRRYDRCLTAYFRDAAGRTMLEAEIEMLKRALETFDFARLRSTYPQLAGGGRATVCLQAETPERIDIVIDDRRVRPLLK